MIIDKLEFKNINSYGNNLHTLEFDEEGGLILLMGENGTGKSTIKQSLELCIFGKVQGKSGKRLALTKLPNRRNGNLYTGVYFKNSAMDDIVMKRFIKPNNFEMTVNEEPFEQRFKVMSDKEREKIIGYNFDVFKSFISFNMNDFKNFISLSKEDKENLLNNNVILDRYFISELVYSKKRGYNGFANHGMRSLIKQIEKRNDVILVYCKTDEETIAYNFKKDKEEYIDITEIKSLSNKYNEIMGKIQLPYIPYDFTMTEPDEICLKIKSIINYKFGK